MAETDTKKPAEGEGEPDKSAVAPQRATPQARQLTREELEALRRELMRKYH
jgi:hypothetical protein